MATYQAPEVQATLTKLEETDLLEFVDDSIKYLKGMQVPFLSKYRDRFGSALWIVPCREYIIDLCQRTLRHTTVTSPLDQFKQDLADVPEVLSVAIFARRQELVKCLTQLVFT